MRARLAASTASDKIPIGGRAITVLMVDFLRVLLGDYNESAGLK
ncbi:hypothetical protein YT1_p10079 (plasmid) [Rhodococcus ruber]|nr:hypothetical protein YT1_p10079 [Rhodococcus ruber]